MRAKEEEEEEQRETLNSNGRKGGDFARHPRFRSSRHIYIFIWQMLLLKALLGENTTREHRCSCSHIQIQIQF